MKKIILLTIILLGTSLFGLIALGEETQTGKIFIDLEKETAVMNIHHVGVSASIPKSDCLKCLDTTWIEDCWSMGFCLDVNID